MCIFIKLVIIALGIGYCPRFVVRIGIIENFRLDFINSLESTSWFTKIGIAKREFSRENTHQKNIHRIMDDGSPLSFGAIYISISIFCIYLLFFGGEHFSFC